MLIDAAVTMKGIYVTIVIPLLLLKKCRNAGFDCDIIIRECIEDEIMAYAVEYTEHNTTEILLVKKQPLLSFRITIPVDAFGQIYLY